MTTPGPHAPPRPPIRRAAWPALAAAIAASLAPSCSLLLSREVEQCDGNGDCAKLGNFVCDRGEGVCVAPGAAPNLAPLEGVITGNRALEAGKEYLLQGIVIVDRGATLTIPAGVTIRGEYSSRGTLVVARGAKIIADGRADAPIVFTSSRADAAQRGDWGGVFIFGRARVNRLGDDQPNEASIEELGLGDAGVYGGGVTDDLDDADDSGILRYVRIEYSGQLPNSEEVDGLTLGGVGSGTRIDHVQVRMTSDDCFQFNGGTAEATYLACQSPSEDGIDWEKGYRGKLQFVVVQNGVVRESGGTVGLSGAHDDREAFSEPLSEPVIANVTLCNRPLSTATEQIGIQLSDGTGARISKAIVTGYYVGVDVESQVDLRQDPTLVPRMVLRESLFFGNTVQNVADEPVGAQDNDLGFSELAWWRGEAEFSGENQLNVEGPDPQIGRCANGDGPVFGPPTALAATETEEDGVFRKAPYLGAFRDEGDNWATAGDWPVWRDY
jgi:hypothetical protein